MRILSTTLPKFRDQFGNWWRLLRSSSDLPRPHVSVAKRPEMEQAALRVVIVGLVLAYLTWYTGRAGAPTTTEQEVLAVAVASFLFSVALVVRVYSGPQTSIPRRIVGVIFDNAVTSYCLIRMGEGGAVILGVYLFVTFGNGFRYGRVYLHLSQALGLAGFSLVLYLSPFWSQHIAIGAGFLVAMTVLPFYVGVLAERIKEERKKANDANQAKGRFLANVSHEMRTPLNGVIAMADVLRETALTEEQGEVVETLGTSANLLLAQIEDVLDMAKIEAGRVQIESLPFDLGRLLSTTTKIIVPQARYKGLAVRTEISPTAERWFLGDSHHLRQVLLNLLANAVKFTDHGHVTLRVTSRTRTGHEFGIRFEVEDTGIGIPLEKQSAIFEAFTQVDDSITRIYGGTGLGTTIAKQLVNLMGGEIGLTSTVGAGSLFWFEIPLIQSTSRPLDSDVDDVSLNKLSSAGMSFALRNAATKTRLRGRRVLVAEDNSTNQRVTQLILDSVGHISTIVSNGDNALNELENGGYDIALLDLSMPFMSGIEVLRTYRFANRNPIPIVILSANVTPEIMADCKRAGAAAFVAKPVRASVLLDAIDHQLLPEVTDRTGESALATGAQLERAALTLVDIPVVDANVLNDLARLSEDPTFVERLLTGFRSDAERLQAQIADALANQRYEELKDAAHALKGGAASVGAKRLMAFAQRLEKADHEKLKSQAVQLKEELFQVTTCALEVFRKHSDDTRRSRSAK